jgi:hypothetical protein
MDQEYAVRLQYPFSGAINAHADTIDCATLAWAETFGLLTPAALHKRMRLQYGLLAARAYPRADREMVQIAADWIAWLFFMDDQCDEAGIGRDLRQMAALHERFVAILEGAAPHAHDWGLTRALADIRRRLAARAPAGWLRRFCEQASLYFTANRWETANRQRGIVPNVSTYCAARLFSGAVYACFSLTELAANIDIPFYARHHATVQQLERCANNIICWCNDILSYPKELRHGDVHNLVLVIQHEQRCSLTEACERALALHDRETASFVQARTCLPHFDPVTDAAIETYVDGLQSWICANRDWSLTAARYVTSRNALERGQVSLTS